MANEFKIKNGLYVSGSVTITNNITVSGSLDIVGGITGSLSGSAISASHALDSDTLGGLPSSSFAPAATFNDVSSSYASASGSLSTRVTDLESTASVLTSASASFAVVSSSYASASGSLSTRVTNLEATSSTVSSSFASTSGSIAGRVTTIESKYATTGSNTFTGAQRITDVSNAIGFASTASLYTDGGLRVTKDSFVSGTAYFNNVVVYGTSSIQYITSSQIAIGANLITLNTNTPSVRYGGISVFDSGSNNQSTGSLFWDSEKDRWIYSNPSGSTYDGGMLISGPRNTSGLGNEVGTTACAVMIGQGADHITSSAIYSYGNATCFYGQSYISSSGAACFAGNLTGTNATFTGSMNVSGSLVITTTAPELTVGSTGVTLGNVISDVHQVTGSLRTTGSLVVNNGSFIGNCVAVSTIVGGAFGTTTLSNLQTTNGVVAGLYANTWGFIDIASQASSGPWIDFSSGSGDDYQGRIRYNHGNQRFDFYVSGSLNPSVTFTTSSACFAGDLTAKTLGTNDLVLTNLNYECANYVDGTRGSWLIQEGACDLFIINQVSGKKYKFNLIEIK